ncbi:MAG: hypothetical protein IPM16_15295 [Chloroflexi bacterium]|nr:hypothetical protein [Chloroflexota bacterium]
MALASPIRLHVADQEHRQQYAADDRDCQVHVLVPIIDGVELAHAGHQRDERHDVGAHHERHGDRVAEVEQPEAQGQNDIFENAAHPANNIDAMNVFSAARCCGNVVAATIGSTALSGGVLVICMSDGSV